MSHTSLSFSSYSTNSVSSLQRELLSFVSRLMRKVSEKSINETTLGTTHALTEFIQVFFFWRLFLQMIFDASKKFQWFFIVFSSQPLPTYQIFFIALHSKCDYYEYLTRKWGFKDWDLWRVLRTDSKSIKFHLYIRLISNGIGIGLKLIWVSSWSEYVF